MMWAPAFVQRLGASGPWEPQGLPPLRAQPLFGHVASHCSLQGAAPDWHHATGLPPTDPGRRKPLGGNTYADQHE